MVITGLRKFSRITNKTLEVIIEKVESRWNKGNRSIKQNAFDY